jgi:AraC-like DNA-binding protein
MRGWVRAFYNKVDAHGPKLDFHSHNEFEIYCFHSGDCTYLISDRVYRLQPGDVIIMNGLTLHRANPLPSKPYVRSVLQFSPEWIRPVLSQLNMPELLDPFQKLNNTLLRFPDNERVNKLVSYIKQMAMLIEEASRTDYQENPQAKEYRLLESQAKTNLLQLLFEIYQHSQYQIDHLSRTDSLKEQHVENIASWIEQHYDQKINLDLMSQSLNISKFYISHIFKEITGATVMEYVMICRLNKAKYLLETARKKSIAEVAEAAGFENMAHFSRFFRQKVGMTPSEYKRQRTKLNEDYSLLSGRSF